LDTKALAEIKITYPNNKEEQQRIVSRLDSAFAHIDELKANAEKQLSEARALFQKALTKAMEPKEGWKEKTIGELTDSCLGKMLDKHKNKGELKPYLRNLNVRWDGFDLDDILEMRFEEGEDDRYGIKEGDLIICEGGEPGRCAIWSNQIANMKIQKALHRVRSKGEIENRFLLFSIMLYSKNGFLDNYESGATIKHLTGEALKRIPISFPPLSEQQRIVERLDALSENIRKYEEIQRQIISECDALKQALLRKVFE
jgi:type I restriction enzyme S subunit